MKSKLQVSNKTELINVPDGTLRYIRKVMTLDNPKFKEAEKHGRWTGNLDPEILLYQDIPNGIAFPRGWTRQCLELLNKKGLEVDIQDHRTALQPVEMHFQGQLRDYQEKAVGDILKRDFGVLEASTGSGKTVMALKVIAERRQPTLILCHTKELLHQWAERIRSFLGTEPGLIGDGKLDVQPVTVGIVNSIRKRQQELSQHFGQIIVDECHRVPSSMFTETVQAFDSKYMLGLSATPYRRDGLGKLVFFTLGDRVHKVSPEELRENGAVMTPEAIRRETAFTYQYRDDYQAMLTALTEDQARNHLIVQDVIRQTTNRPGVALVVSDRVAHCEALAALLKDRDMEARILTGQTPRKDREGIVAEVQAGRVKALVSTVQLLGEGFDCSGLTSLFLATPIKFKGRLLQVVGRILRPADGKRPKVFDYIDSEVGVLKAIAISRYRALAELEK